MATGVFACSFVYLIIQFPLSRFNFGAIWFSGVAGILFNIPFILLSNDICFFFKVSRTFFEVDSSGAVSGQPPSCGGQLKMSLCLFSIIYNVGNQQNIL